MNIKHKQTYWPNNLRLHIEQWYDNDLPGKTIIEKLHRNDGPAEIRYYCRGDILSIEYEAYYVNSIIHNSNGPAYIEYNTCLLTEDRKYYNKTEEEWYLENGNISQQHKKNGKYLLRREYFYHINNIDKAILREDYVDIKESNGIVHITITKYINRLVQGHMWEHSTNKIRLSSYKKNNLSLYEENEFIYEQGKNIDERVFIFNDILHLFINSNYPQKKYAFDNLKQYITTRYEKNPSLYVKKYSIDTRRPHRLDGPALIDKTGKRNIYTYCYNGEYMLKKEWLKIPEVVNHIMNKLINDKLV
jgi:hypothetical protein